MKTFIFENVGASYFGSGHIIVTAETADKAMDLVIKKYSSRKFIKNCGEKKCILSECLIHRIRELKENDIMYIEGWE
jgi:hypothetical protein